jgi:hypothetical protein
MVDTGATRSKVPARRRLGVGHFLLWMVGCGVVLAIYRAATDFSEVPEDVVLQTQVMQLGYGLGYGTAISGLGLFLWWWWRGVGTGPTQPGHWLLVFGGVGLIIDLAAAGSVELAVWLAENQRGYWSFMLYQLLGWSAALLIGILVLARLRTSVRWTILAWLLVTLFLLYTLTYAAALAGQLAGVPGSWSWWLPVYIRLVGPIVFIPAVTVTIIADRAAGHPRDWLHLAGIFTTMALAIVDFAAHVRLLI